MSKPLKSDSEVALSLVECGPGTRQAMKNQSFHQRKIRIQEPPKVDFDELKARTINALRRLGEQKFSAEPGGYTLGNWSRGVNVLLDEFEEKVGGARISKEYLARRQELNDYLSKPISTSSIDKEMAELRERASELENRIETERDRVVSRISELKTEQSRCSVELEREQRQAAGPTARKTNGSFFGRLLGRNTSPPENPESRINELKAKLADLQAEMHEQQRHLKMMDTRSPDSQLADEWNRLGSLQTRMKELEEQKMGETQLVKERAAMTASIADAVSRLS